MSRLHRLRLWGAAAVLFGLATVLSGGRALFGGDAARAAVGQAVDFVLWFNFVAGFAYVGVGAGLWRARPWAARAALAIAAATGVVAAGFAVHVATGQPFEPRTIGALALRLLFWLALAVQVRHLLVRP